MTRQTGLVEGYVVHARPWRESSALYRLVVQGHGWIRLVHRGGRTARGGGRMLPVLTPVRVSWSGRGELATLGRHEAGPRPLVRTPERQVQALYVNEIMSHLLPGDLHLEELYPLYEETLRALSDAPDTEPVLRGFELDLLQIAGHPVQLDHTEDGPVCADARYRVLPGTAPVECAEDAGVCGATLLSLHERAPRDARCQREARDLMRMLLDHYAAPKRIRARDIMRAMQKESSPWCPQSD